MHRVLNYSVPIQSNTDSKVCLGDVDVRKKLCGSQSRKKKTSVPSCILLPPSPLATKTASGCFAEMKNLALNRKNPGAGPGRCVEVAASLAACFYRLFPVKVRSPSIRAGTVTYSQRGLPETLQAGRDGGAAKAPLA